MKKRHFLRRLQAAFLLPVFLLSTLTPLRSAVPQLMNYQGRVTVAGTNFDGAGWFKFSLVDGGANQNKTATATCTITSSGRVSGVTLISGGNGYTSVPPVTFEGTGTGAVATAVVTNGAVTSITVGNAGGGFSTVAPTLVVIGAPPEDFRPTTLWSHDGTGAFGGEPQRGLQLTVKKGLYSTLLGDPAVMKSLPSQIFTNEDVRLRAWFSSDDGQNYTLLTPDQRIAAVGYALMADAVKPGAITAEMLASNAIGLAQLTPELRQTIQGLQAWQATQLPVVTSVGAADAAVDVPFTYQIAATGSPSSYVVTGLPAGWTVNTSTGVITATPAAGGTVNLSATAMNVAGASVSKAIIISVSEPVFVDFATGNDSNTGTQAAPVKTMSQGVAVAGAGAAKKSVRVSGAAQPLSAVLQLVGGVPVRGGYDRAAGWTRTAPRTQMVLIGSSPTAVLVEARNLAEPVLFDGFALTGPSALAASSSAMGVRVFNCTQLVTLANCTIASGNGATGLAGMAGTPGIPATDGFDAVNYRGPYWPQNQYLVNNYALSARYGLGGTGLAQEELDDIVVSQYEGYPGKTDFPGGGAGGLGGVGGSPNGSNGQPGADGNPGTGGPHGTPSTGIQLSETFSSTPGGDGTLGGFAKPGGGGGGGGGSGNLDALYGGGGGGGGGGGLPGKGGKGGKGGGGSFSVVVVNSPVSVTNCTLLTANAGAGGTGGNGGVGGPGGEGGTGFVTPVYNGFNPGNGGNGGDGGQGGGGGGGGGGQGGPNAGIIANANSTLTQSANTFTLGSAGAGGLGGLRGGSASNRAPSGPAGAQQNVITGVLP